MFYRAVAILVVLFWLTMTALLLRNEVTPGDSALREVPFTHVVKLLFHHQQVSSLNVMSDKMRMGALRIHPQVDKTTGRWLLSFDGNLQFTIPGQKPQRVKWDGDLDLDKSLETKSFRIGVTTYQAGQANQSSRLRSEIRIFPEDRRARYELSSDTGTLERQDFTLDESGARQAVEQLGLDPALLASVKSQRLTSLPVIKAIQSSLEIRGEAIDTYLVTVEYNGQTLIEVHVSQLGQVLKASTMLGYTLVPDDLVP